MVKRITAAFLAALTLLFAFFSCGKKKNDENITSAAEIGVGVGRIGKNTVPCSDMTDGDKLLCDLVYSKLISSAPDGSVVCGDDSAAAAKSFRAFYADENFEESSEESVYTAFEFTIKNGMKFSDGSDLTAEDVLFSIYYYIDPECGESAFSSLPIAGLENYLYQRGDMGELLALSFEIADKGMSYIPAEDDSFTADQSQIFWDCFDSAGSDFAENIVKYVADNYCTDELVSTYVLEGFTADSVKEDNGFLHAYAMMLWNYGTFVYSYEADENGKYVALVNEDGTYSYKTSLEKAMEDDMYIEYVPDENGKYYYDYDFSGYAEIVEDGYHGARYAKVLSGKYTTVSRKSVEGFRDMSGKLYNLDDTFPTSADFFAAVKEYYTEDGRVDYKRMEATEAAFDGDSVFDSASVSFAEKLAASTAQPFVKGIVEGNVVKDGEEYKTVTLYLENASYDCIENMDIYILSRTHMTDGFDAGKDAVKSYGMPLDSEDFATHVKNLSKPLGSGPYVFSCFSDDGERALLSANSQFYTMGGDDVYNPSVSVINLIQVPIGKEAEMTESGEVDICLVSSNEDMNEDIYAVKSDIASYDCIVVNPAYYININTRKAIFSVLDTELAGDGVIDYSLPDFLWAYPDMPRESLYDETLESARGYFENAGYTFNENGEMIDPSSKSRAKFVFTLLPTETESAVYKIFEKAADHLKSLGASAEIVCDSDLMYNIYSDDGVAIYAMGWEIGSGTGLFDRYALSSGSDALKANGMTALYENGLIDNFGTVETINSDGTPESFNESDAVRYLDSLITEGKSSIDIKTKKEIYSTALSLISDLYFELPLTCRSKKVLISSDIDAGSLVQNSSEFCSVMSEAWKIKLGDADSVK